jgi:hypothetical protein
MDRRYIEENQIIDRYLMNKLSGDDMEAFERLFLEDPELVQEIELRKRFIRGLRNADRTRSFQINNDEPSGIWRWSPVIRHAFPTVAAISVAILLLVAVLQYSQITRLQTVNQKQVSQIRQMMAPQVNTVLVPLGRTRGSSAREEPVVRVHLAPSVEQVILTLDIEPVSFDHYRFSLERDGAGRLWSHESDSAPSAVVLPTELLIPGNYYLHIQGVRSGEVLAPVAQFSFTVLEN